MTKRTDPTHSQDGPAWEVARLFPQQGAWTVEEYLALSERSNRVVEMCEGRVEVPEMSGRTHQRILARLYRAIEEFVTANGLGEVIAGPYPVKLGERTFRQPDVVYASSAHAGRLGERFAQGADWVIEVLGLERNRDIEIKQGEYAAAGITEFWVVDPRIGVISVFELRTGVYEQTGAYRAGECARSVMLPGFGIGVADLLSS